MLWIRMLDQGLEIFKTSVDDPMNISLCGNDTDNPRDGKELPGPFLLLPSRIRAVLQEEKSIVSMLDGLLTRTGD